MGVAKCFCFKYDVQSPLHAQWSLPTVHTSL